MKKTIFLQSFICLFAISCTVRELDVITPTPDESDVFYASLESYEPDTKVSIDKDINILWDVDDQISIFNKSTLNQQYRFDGDKQANSGSFSRVPNGGYFGAGNNLDFICSVYPYQESTTISNSDVLTLTLPDEQIYKPNSFGLGANTMVSVTDNHILRFKNVCGYLALKFYGENVTVKSIILAGRNEEPLAGEATLALPFDEEPEIQMASTARKSIVLNCGENGVTLGTTSEDATIFWLVVPPTYFANGFTLLVTDMNGDAFIKETSYKLNIERNSLRRIAAIEVDMDSAGLHIDDGDEKDDIFSPDQKNFPFKTEVDESNRTVTITTPTLNRSHLVIDYNTINLSLMADGQNIVPGVTPFNVTKPVTLTVRNGNHGKNYTLTAQNTGLPIVRITTTGFTLKDLTDEKNAIDSDDGLDHRTWHSGTTVRIEYPDGSEGMNQILEDNTKAPVYDIATQIKGRGNYTWIWEKKPFALKLDKKREVLGMPAHKRWVLLANWRDHTLLRNDVTFELSRRAGLPYTVRGQFVELEFNGEYQGNYYLCEQIKIDENRVNITPLEDDFNDLSGGYLMEIDSYWDEVNKFKSQYFNLKYMFKEPDEDPSDPAFARGSAWMEHYINEFERVLKTRDSVADGEYENYLNVDSAILFMLLNEVSGNRDYFQPSHTQTNDVYGPHSTYLYKNKGGKLFFGPGWDFDYETFIPAKWYSGGNYQWRGFTQTGYYYYNLCYDKEFRDQVKSLWNSKKSAFLDVTTDKTGYIDIMVEKIGLSQEFDIERWPFNRDQDNRNDNHDFYYNGTYYSYQEAISLMKSSLSSRISWMNTQINNKLSQTSPSWSYYNKSSWPTN